MSNSDSDIFEMRWHEIEALFEELLDMPTIDCEKRLAKLRTRDRGLSDAVEKMLRAAEDESFLEAGAGSLSEEAIKDIFQHVDRHQNLNDPDAPNAARTIGRYELDRHLGSGGMSEVWLAHRADDSLQQTVAVKLLHPFLGREAEQRFVRERNVLAALQHDGIARILDAGIATGDPAYLVLEYVDGTSITDYCRENALGLTQVLQLFQQICDAVEFAHRQLVVHRDIKPSNVLVTADGKVKLLDFGIAKLIDDSQDRALTRSGVFPMTPEYAAPEQIRGDAISTATDVYALGGLLYEMLTGKRPFDTSGMTPLDAAKLVFDTDPERPSTQAEERSWQAALRGDLDAIILKSLQVLPGQRYGSVAEFSADIHRFLSGLPVNARPAGPVYRFAKFLKRNRTPLLIGTVVVVAIVASLANMMIQREREKIQIARFNSAGTALFGLFELIDPELTPGKQLSPTSMLDYFSEQLSAIDIGPQAKVDLLRVLGVMYNRLGEYDRGESLLREAVETAQRTLDPSNSTIGQTMSSLGHYLSRQGSLAQAEEYQRDALMVLTRTGDTGHWILRTKYELAKTLALQGRHQEALALHKESVDGYPDLQRTDPRPSTPREFIEAQNGLARMYIAMSTPHQALPVLQSAVENAATHLESNHPELGRALEGIADVNLASGNADTAREALTRALSIFREAYPNGHHAVGRTMVSIAGIEADVGNRAEAMHLVKDALSVWHGIGEGTPLQMAERYRVRADFELDQGNFDIALQFQRMAVEQRNRAHESNRHRSVIDELQRLKELESLVDAPVDSSAAQ